MGKGVEDGDGVRGRRLTTSAGKQKGKEITILKHVPYNQGKERGTIRIDLKKKRGISKILDSVGGRVFLGGN